MDDLPESIDLEPVRRDKPVEFAGRVQRLGFREGIVVAVAILIVLSGLGVVAFGPGGERPSPSLPGVALTSPSSIATAGLTPTPASNATAAPSPAVTPGSRCGSQPPSDPPYVRLLGRSEETVGLRATDSWQRDREPLGSTTDGTDATVALAEPVFLSVGLQACAYAWRVSVDGVVVQEQANPAMDPTFARQGYFTITLPPLTPTRAVLQLDLRFPNGWSTSRWVVTPDPPAIPTAVVVAGDQAVEVWPGCGFSVRLRNGSAGSEVCFSTVPEGGLPTIYVPVGTKLTFRVPQAGFIGASTGAVACGHVQGERPDFVVDPSCDLSPGRSSTDDVTFVAPSEPGIWAVVIDGCASRSVGTACGEWYVMLDTQHPARTPIPGTP